MNAHRNAGFTLLEMLAALVVLGFLMAGLTGGVRLGLRAWEQQARAGAGQADLDTADRTLRRLVNGIDPGTVTRSAAVTGRADRLAMIVSLPASATLERAEVAIGVAGQRLVMRWVPQPAGIRVGPPPAAQETELLTGVAALRFAYWPRPGKAGDPAPGWRDSWDAPGPPALIRIRLTFVDARHWPDIIAAPMREQAGAR